MPLLPFSPCDIPAPETSCDFLFETAEALLEAAAEGLADYIPPAECGDTFETYVSMNPPQAEFYDALSIHLRSYGTRAPAPKSANGMTYSFPLQRAVWSIRLWENQYPGAERIGDELHVPSPDKLTKVNEHVYAHGMGLYNTFIAKVVNAQIPVPEQIGTITWGDLTPLGPEGVAVGWAFEVVTEVG